VRKILAFNEYGSNLLKYKYDLPAVIEAKFAMTQKKMDEGGIEQDSGRQMSSNGEEMEMIPESPVMQTQPSPEKGTQEAPGVELSSQEDMNEKGIAEPADQEGQGKDNQASPNWDEIENEELTGNKSKEEFAMMGHTNDKNTEETAEKQGEEDALIGKGLNNRTEQNRTQLQPRQSQRIKE
jgi:hypothetical protein